MNKQQGQHNTRQNITAHHSVQYIHVHVQYNTAQHNKKVSMIGLSSKDKELVQSIYGP